MTIMSFIHSPFIHKYEYFSVCIYYVNMLCTLYKYLFIFMYKGNMYRNKIHNGFMYKNKIDRCIVIGVSCIY